MSSYSKALGLHVYLPTIKKSYFVNDKYIEVNVQAMEALRHTLSKEHISLVSHCGSAFAVWNTLTSPKQQMINKVETEAIMDESNEACYTVQGIDSLKVHSDTHLDDSASSSNNDHAMDAHVLNEELSIFCENLLSKYKTLKSKSLN